MQCAWKVYTHDTYACTTFGQLNVLQSGHTKLLCSRSPQLNNYSNLASSQQKP